MKPIRLYIDNFMCHDDSFIDFTQFNSALIVGKIENNELYSNGVGKTTIFKAIEYVLFNKSDINLEKIIRDDATSCQVVMDFLIEDQEYRILRKRTKKGSKDLSLFVRNTVAGLEEVYHTVNNNVYTPISDSKYWKEITGRRDGDTEKELEKLIKINFKAFRNTIHFIQNDFSGIAADTPEKRKLILKEALNLIIYSKLEKKAKEKASILSKEIDKNNILIENLGDPKKDLSNLENELIKSQSFIDQKYIEFKDFENKLFSLNEEIDKLTNSKKSLQDKFSSLLDKEKIFTLEKSKLEIYVKEYYTKKINAVKFAKDLIEEVKILKNNQEKLSKLDYSQIDIINEVIISDKEKVTHNNILIKNNISLYEELKIPMPDDAICKHCRQSLSDEHKNICKSKINEDMRQCQDIINKSKKEITILNGIISNNQTIVNNLILSRQELENINFKISSKEKEVNDKRDLYSEYNTLLSKFSNELEIKTTELNIINEEINNSSLSEINKIDLQIEENKKKVSIININNMSLNKEINHTNSCLTIIKHNMEQKNKDNDKLNLLTKSNLELTEKYSVYPSVLQAFSSTGIPNLIIQNVLDNLQIEANNLLNQLKPGLQLSFIVEKTIEKTGDQADTLDINYHLNGKDRYYEQLSGAQKLAVTFSLKLGLSFLLQKIIGTNIKFLLLDEIDQSLDKASVDAFADIVKFFQKEFSILIITHNDRLKDKFSHAILVEQDMNLISRAKVVSSW